MSEESREIRKPLPREQLSGSLSRLNGHGTGTDRWAQLVKTTWARTGGRGEARGAPSGARRAGDGRHLRLPAMSLRLSDVTALLDGWYDPAWAEDWDAVGLVCGDPEQPVARVLFAVDPAPAVVDEALAWGADLVVCHHPLLLSPVHGVAATTPKGRVVHRLQRTGTALLTAHTNADVPADGVNESLARAVGILDPQVVVASDGAPAAYDVEEPAPGTDRATRGHGRIGRLAEPTTLGEFAARVSAALPATAHGVRVAGDPDRRVRDRRGRQRVRRLHAGHRARHRRRRLPDLRPAPPPGRGVPRARRAGAGRRRALGGGVDLAAGGRAQVAGRGPAAGGYGGDPGQRARHRPVDLPGGPLTHRRPPRAPPIPRSTR